MVGVVGKEEGSESRVRGKTKGNTQEWCSITIVLHVHFNEIQSIVLEKTSLYLKEI